MNDARSDDGPIALPIDPRVAGSFAAQGLMATLGARLVAAADGVCAIEAPHGPHLAQQDGFFHAGATAAIADTAAGYAAYTLMEPGARVLTVEFKIALMRPAAGDLLRAEATVIRAGRSVTTVEATARVRRDGAWHDCARFLGTMMSVRG